MIPIPWRQRKWPGERVAHCCSMFSFARELAIAKMRQDGDLTQAQLRQRLFLHFYGREFDEDERLKIHGDSYFNATKVSKKEWVKAGIQHHNFFDDISNNKIQPAVVTTSTYDNGSVSSLAWFW